MDFLAAQEDGTGVKASYRGRLHTVGRGTYLPYCVQKEKMHFEMHFEPAGVPDGEEGRLVRGHCTDMIATAATVQNGFVTFGIRSHFTMA